MARMHRSDQIAYPNLATLVRHYLPTLPSAESSTWQAFRRHCRLREARARDALQWGQGPQLRFTSRYLPVSDAAQFVAGPDARSAAIWIRSRVAKQMNDDWSRWEARLRAEALILHEMTHWGDWLPDGTLIETTETGVDFEQQAYGGFRPVRFDYRMFRYPPTLHALAPPESPSGAG